MSYKDFRREVSQAGLEPRDGSHKGTSGLGDTKRGRRGELGLGGTPQV
jgi:hypothetical protein